MSDIFISYKREERPTALKLATALEGVGWTVWWDLELVGGERFDDVIEAALNEAQCVVVLWSKLSVRSDFVKDEASHALKQGKLLPARIDDTEVPLRFERLHTIDLPGQGQLPGASGFEELVEHITKRIGRPVGVVKSGVAVDEAAPKVSPVAEEKKPAPIAVEPEMVVVPAGRFTMGAPTSDFQSAGSERPTHEVVFSKSFAIGKYQVTFEEYEAFTRATGQTAPEDGGWGRGRRPVINVSWDDAQAYTTWLATATGKRYRLPTEAEWEYAARGGTTTKFSFGDDDAMLGKYAWSDTNSNNQAHEVGTRKPNPWGLHDVHGNVLEWARDCWHANYTDAPTDGSAWLGDNGGDCGRRVIRGGSWGNSPRNLRSSFRNGSAADGRSSRLGFRLAQDL